MGHHLRSAWFAVSVVFLSAAAPACAGEEQSDRDASTQRIERQVEELKDRLEVKRRDLQARCNQGDTEACSEAICMLLMTEGVSAERYRDCARSQGFKTTASWAQFSELRHSNHELRISIVCLTHPEVMTLGGKQVKVFHQFELEANTAYRANVYHDRNRFYANLLGGTDFATWEEAADEHCSERNIAK